MPFVLDCSVTLSWCFEDEANVYADAVHDSLADEASVVPAVWVYEVANVLAVGERRGRITNQHAAEFTELLSGLRISVADCDRFHLLREVRDLALRSGLAAYDAAYLDMSIRTGLPLATIDEALRAAAIIEGVPLYVPGGQR